MQDSVLKKESFLTVTDLSALQFTCVAMSAANTVASNTSDTTPTVGILYNNPKGTSTSPKEAEVAVSGIAKVLAGGAITQGAIVVPTSGGAVIVTTTTKKFAVGIALDAADNGDLVRVKLGTFQTNF